MHNDGQRAAAAAHAALPLTVFLDLTGLGRTKSVTGAFLVARPDFLVTTVIARTEIYFSRPAPTAFKGRGQTATLPHSDARGLECADVNLFVLSVAR